MASRRELDPFRIILGVVESSDTLTRVAHAAGLRFDLALTEREEGAHKTRIRAYLPRILAAYDAVDDEQQLTVARAAVGELMAIDRHAAARVSEALARVGWEIRDSDLAIRTPEVREVFFPKGSPWDAFVVLRDLFGTAKAELVIVDAYCDGTAFQMLAPRDVTGLRVRVLCLAYAAAVAAEAKRFTAQHPGVDIQVRQAKDFHDRFVVIDGTDCIHIGASIKDAGKTAFMVSRLEDDANRNVLLTSIEASWIGATPVV
jgi:hypothetical protein